MARPWSILRHPPSQGAWNMAADEALLSSVTQGPVFRIYGWQDWTLSLGRFQDPNKDLRKDFLENPGFPMVRRMTGGGAILHGQEITYSLVLKQEDLGTKSVHQSFEILCGILIRFYRLLGFSAVFAKDLQDPTQPLGQKTPFCFAGKELYDLTIQGQKIGGNAQRRFKDVIFQHGSIPLHLNESGLREVFPKQYLAAPGEITSLRALGVEESWQELADLLQQAFQEEAPKFTKSAHPQLGERVLSEGETSLARSLQASVYDTMEWTLEKNRPKA